MDVREESDSCLSWEIGFFRGRGLLWQMKNVEVGQGRKCFENMPSQRIQLTPEQYRGWGTDLPDGQKSTCNL